MMKGIQKKQKKSDYDRMVKIIKDAEKAAEKFIQKSKTSNSQPNYL